MLKTSICLTVSTLMLTVALLPGRAQAPASDAQKQPANAPVTADMRPHNSAKVVIPELTEVSVIFKGEIQAGENRAGSELVFAVAKDVYGPGHTLLIACGTPAVGQIVETQTSRKVKRAGKRVLRCDYVLAQDKTRIPLRGMSSETRGEAQQEQVVLLAPTDSGAIVDRLGNGKDAKLPLGKTYRVYVNVDTQTEAPKTADSQADASQGAPREAYVLLNNGDWAIGMLRQVGNTYILTNFQGARKVNISDVRTLEYLQDARLPAPNK
jgi:hypothetical protein